MTDKEVWYDTYDIMYETIIKNKMFETKIVDNFLNENEQKLVHDSIMASDWKFLNDVSGVNNHSYPSHGFVHVLKHPDIQKRSPNYLPIVNNIFQPKFYSFGLEVKEVHYTRAFLQIPMAPQYKKEHNGIHVDLPKEIKHIACIYYCNGSDGDTIIYDQTSNDAAAGSVGVALTEHQRVTPQRGRMVFFDGSRYHCSSQPTINYRCIINFDLILRET
jgi:hypothetical protein